VTYPKKKQRVRMGVKDPETIRCQAHKAWVRNTHSCLVGAGCEGRNEAAHVRTGTDGGMGKKPSDIWIVPLCSYHHSEQHTLGERAFEKKYKINMKEAAMYLSRTSPHRAKWEQQ